MAFIQRSHIVTIADRGDASCANTSNAVYALCRGLKYYVSAKNGYTLQFLYYHGNKCYNCVA